MIGDVLAPTHLLLIMLVALLVFGPKRLPELGRSLGKGLRDFREAMTSYSPDALLNSDEPQPSAAPAAPPEPSTMASATEPAVEPSTMASATEPAVEPTADAATHSHSAS